VHWDFSRYLHCIACLGQLKALIQSPYERATEETYRAYECSSLYYVVKSRLVDHLAKAEDPHIGMPVKDLGQILDVDPRKLKHVLHSTRSAAP